MASFLKRDFLKLWTLVWTLVQVGCTTHFTAYLEDHCSCKRSNKRLHCEPFVLEPVLEGSGWVHLSRRPVFTDDFYCHFTIRAPHGRKLQLLLHQVDIPRGQNCERGALKLYDGSPRSKAFEIMRICGRLASETLYRTTSNVVSLYYFQREGHLPPYHGHLNISFTYFYIAQTGATKCNTTNDYLCQNNICIPANLKCDGVDNCGDQSDESLDFQACGNLTQSDPVVGLSLGLSLGLAIILTLIATAIVRHKRKKSSPGHHREVPPASNHQTSPDQLSGRACVLPNHSACISTDQHQMSLPAGHRAPPPTHWMEAALPPDDLPPSYSSLFPDS